MRCVSLFGGGGLTTPLNVRLRAKNSYRCVSDRMGPRGSGLLTPRTTYSTICSADDRPRISAILLDRVVVRSVVVLIIVSIPADIITRRYERNTKKHIQLCKYTIKSSTSTARNSKEHPLCPQAP